MLEFILEEVKEEVENLEFCGPWNDRGERVGYIPIVDQKTMEKVPFVLGFQRVRQKGGHVFYKHSNGRYL